MESFSLKSNNRFLQILGILVLVAIVGWCTFTRCFQNNGIFDYDAARDKVAVRTMFHEDYKFLYFGNPDEISVNDFDVDFMLDQATSSQYSARHDLVMKVMREEGRTVGFLAYHPRSPYWWHMLFIVVDKKYRRKGYAAQLVQYFIDDVIKRGAIKISTFTRLKNTRARALYEDKFKFKATVLNDEHYQGNYVDLVLYPKK